MTFKTSFAMAIIATLASGATAAAQNASPPPPPASPLEEPAGPTGSLIIDQQRADRLPAAPATSRPQITPPAAQVAPAPAAPAAQAAATIRAIALQGASLPDTELRPIWEPFVGQALTQANLQALANALTRAYAESDIALPTVGIPAQTFQDGVVNVVVTEGAVGQVAITGDVQTKHLRLLKRYAAKIAEERPLHRRTLERYLSLTRDIPGLTVEPKLQPSSLPGVYVLTLDIKRRQVKPEFSVHDRGTPRLGRVQLQGSVIINSLLQQGDSTRLTLAAPTEWDPFQYVAVAHSMPIGTEGLTVTANVGYMSTRPKDQPLEGEAVTAGVTFTYPLIRGFRENLYLTAGLDGQDSDNAVFGRTISSDHTRTLRLGMSWSKAEARSVTQIAATVSQGLDILSAETDARLTDVDYRKLNLHLARNQQLSQSFVARLRATAQLSDGRLPSAEQFVLGGEPFGRAFSSAYLAGDSGMAVSGELAWISQNLWPKSLAGSELYGFADWGEACMRSRFDGLIPSATRDLASAGVGVRLNWKRKTIFNVEGATSLENPYPENEAWRLLFGWRSIF